MAFEAGPVIEEEGQGIVDFHRREVLAATLVFQAENLRELARSRVLVARGHDGVVERDGHGLLPAVCPGRCVWANSRLCVSRAPFNPSRYGPLCLPAAIRSS